MSKDPTFDPNVRVPRYTSYPTSPHFHSGVGTPAYRQWLECIDDREPLSLYVHVPFCRDICWYCGCHTKATHKYEVISDYLDVLMTEISSVADAIPERAPVNHLHWGGGTPTILSATDFSRVMALIGHKFSICEDAEIAVEIDPRNVSTGLIDAMAAAGVTRASLGVQDLNPHVQAAMNRVQPFEVVRDVVSELRRAGIADINFDLMYGLPLQSLADIKHSIDLSTSLTPDRIAAFGYAHVPWMKAHQKKICEATLPDIAERYDQAQFIAQELPARGYRQIGIDHFALHTDPLAEALDTGRLRRNFQGYTDDQATCVLGFGASAITSLRQAYVQNHSDFGSYARAVKTDGLAANRGRELKTEDLRRRAIIEQLMCALQVDLDAVATDTDCRAAQFSSELDILGSRFGSDLVEIDGGHIRVTEKGRPMLRVICATFDQYLDPETGRHSVAV